MATLNTQRSNRNPLGLKADRSHHVITNNPSTANPKETLYVRIPRLTENNFYIPNTIYLPADVVISGNANNHMVNNLARNLIAKMVVKWGTETILQIDNYHLYSSFKDVWLTAEEREDKIFQEIQDEALRKLRLGVAVADASLLKI
jgi:hypothetical protein